MFLIQGDVTAADFVLDGFTITGTSTIGDSNLTNAADSVFLELSGSYQNVQLNNLNLLDSTTANW